MSSPMLNRSSSGNLESALGKANASTDDFLTNGEELTMDHIHSLTMHRDTSTEDVSQGWGLGRSPAPGLPSAPSSTALSASSATTPRAASLATDFNDDARSVNASPYKRRSGDSSPAPSADELGPPAPAVRPRVGSAAKLPRVAMLSKTEPRPSPQRDDSAGLASRRSGGLTSAGGRASGVAGAATRTPLRGSPSVPARSMSSRATPSSSTTSSPARPSPRTAVATPGSSRPSAGTGLSPARSGSVTGPSSRSPAKPSPSGASSLRSVSTTGAAFSDRTSPTTARLSPGGAQPPVRAGGSAKDLPAALRRDPNAVVLPSRREGNAATPARGSSRIGAGLASLREKSGRGPSKVKEAEAAARALEEETPETRHQLETLHSELQDLKRELELGAAEREQAERKAREEAERLEKEEAKRLEKEEAERLEKEEAERREKEEAERREKEEAERLEKQEAERLEAERLETERLESEAAEREAAEKEAAEREAAERDAEAQAAAEKEAAEKAAAEAELLQRMSETENGQKWRSLNDYDPTRGFKPSPPPDPVQAKRCCGCTIQ